MSSSGSSPPLWNYLVSGATGGIAMCVVGHPLDTIKGRMQAHRPAFRGALYAGMSVPLVTSGFLNLVLFTVTHAMRRVVHPDSSTPLSLKEVIFAAWLTSPLYVLAVTPVEMIKVNVQLGKLKSPLEVVKHVGARGLWRGYIPTTGMRLVGLPAYFGAYEAAKRYYGYPEKSLSMMEFLNCGGLAGFCFWAVNFPLDTIKTRMQSSLKPIGPMGALRQIGSVRLLYRGLAPALVRSYPANAACFLSVEYTMQVLKTLRE